MWRYISNVKALAAAAHLREASALQLMASAEKLKPVMAIGRSGNRNIRQSAGVAK